MSNGGGGQWSLLMLSVDADGKHHDFDGFLDGVVLLPIALSICLLRMTF